MSLSVRAEVSIVFIEDVKRQRKLVQHQFRMSLPTARPDGSGSPPWDCARRSAGRNGGFEAAAAIEGEPHEAEADELFQGGAAVGAGGGSGREDQEPAVPPRRSGDARQCQGHAPHGRGDVPQQCPGGLPGHGAGGPEAAAGGGCGGGSEGPGDQRRRSDAPAAAVPGREHHLSPAGRLRR